jgi:lysozyme family protein
MSFDTDFDRLMSHEGGYVNDPKDPGGETQWGITWPVLLEAVALGIVPTDTTIKTLTREQAKAIYKRFFYDAIGEAHPAIKFQVFDFAVNSGIHTAIRKLQLAVGVADDGRWGPHSAQVLKAADVNDVLMRFNGLRLRFMTDLKNWPAASRGWARRISDNLLYAAQDNG